MESLDYLTGTEYISGIYQGQEGKPILIERFAPSVIYKSDGDWMEYSLETKSEEEVRFTNV